MKSEQTAAGGGIGLGGLLFVAFLCMKLGVGDTKVMDWSWWWVTSPLWIPVAIVVGVVAFILALGAVGLLVASLRK